MRRVILILIISTFIFKVDAQQLLANGSLNDQNICIERHALCAPEGWFFIPTYTSLPSLREEGNFCELLTMGNIFGTHGSRNYIYTKILCTLKTTKMYKFSVWVNTAKNIFDHLDIWLGPYEPGQKKQNVPIAGPAFTITSEHEDSTKGLWKKYNYIYTAKGGEQFLMLGNLSAEGLDKSKIMASSNNGVVNYAIDDIALTPIEGTVKVCPEYNAVKKQVYDQNRRHPAGLIEDIKPDTLLILKDTAVRKKEIIWVIVDTPPSLKKPLNDTLTLPDILFLYNSSKLNPKFTKDLNTILKKLKDRPFAGLEIKGHTDNKGTSAYNLTLSIDRANAIKDYLVTRLQISPEIVMIKGMGETDPIKSNETVEGRQRNRRVEIIVKH